MRAKPPTSPRGAGADPSREDRQTDQPDLGNESNPFRRHARAAAERTGAAAEAAGAGRLCLPEPYFHSDTPSVVAAAAAAVGTGPLRVPEIRLDTSASRVASGSSRTPSVQPSLQSELPSVSFEPPRFDTAKTRRGAPYVIGRSNGSLVVPAVPALGRKRTLHLAHFGAVARNTHAKTVVMTASN